VRRLERTDLVQHAGYHLWHCLRYCQRKLSASFERLPFDAVENEARRELL
jgi:hypothetical protein